MTNELLTFDELFNLAWKIGGLVYNAQDPDLEKNRDLDIIESHFECIIDDLKEFKSYFYQYIIEILKTSKNIEFKCKIADLCISTLWKDWIFDGVLANYLHHVFVFYQSEELFRLEVPRYIEDNYVIDLINDIYVRVKKDNVKTLLKEYQSLLESLTK